MSFYFLIFSTHNKHISVHFYRPNTCPDGPEVEGCPCISKTCRKAGLSVLPFFFLEISLDIASYKFSLKKHFILIMGIYYTKMSCIMTCLLIQPTQVYIVCAFKIYHDIPTHALSPCAIHQTQIDMIFLYLYYDKSFSCHVPSI